jgi:hypothetical protein
MRKSSVLVLCIVGGIIACLVLFFVFLYTPTITVHIQNDTSGQLTVSSCGSDPETIDPGQSANIDPNANDPNAACVVYRGNTTAEIGCLYIPTTRYLNGSTARLSATIPGVPADKCGD